jgi:hypothetical protein
MGLMLSGITRQAASSARGRAFGGGGGVIEPGRFSVSV